MNTTANLQDKIALVTGGIRSIGAAVAKRLAREGATVAITYHASPDKAREVVAAIEAEGGKAIAVQADAGNPEAVRLAVTQVAERFGRIDILVNNAGIIVLGEPTDIALEDFQRILATDRP